jgi:hypothetical protein
MQSRYIEPEASRFRREIVEGIEQIRIPMRRNWFVLLFIGFWICGWTVGGIAAMTEVAKNPEAFLIFWLGAWALGWIFAAATIASQIGGSEIIRVVGGDLEISDGVGTLRRRRLYRGDHIRRLIGSDPNPMGFPFRFGSNQLPFARPRQGAIKFDYGAQTIYAANSIDEAEGRMIVTWLSPKLPRSAAEV